MTRTTVRTTLIATVSTLAIGVFGSQAPAEEGARAAVREVPPGQYFVDCWIGMKWGDQPGQIMRGWICERPFVPAAKAASAPSPRAHEEKEDVATVGLDGVRR
jgi:hypothetical protein